MFNFLNSLNIRKLLKTPYLWALLLVLGLSKLFSLFPRMADLFYGRGLFLGLRYAYDYTLGFLPFPMIYLVFVILILILVRFFWRLRAECRSKGIAGAVVLPVIKFLIVVFCLFYILWGFNYQRTDLKDLLTLEKTQVDSSYLKAEIETTRIKMMSLRSSFDLEAGAVLTGLQIPDDMEDQIRGAQRKLLSSWNLPSGPRVRVRKLKPKGTLLRIATAGVYIPFAMEGHIDAGLHPIQWPATMAHEMAHGYGLTDEGVCNFVGFVSCLETEDPYIQYSGWMMYLRYLISNARKIGVKEWTSPIPDEIKLDLKAIHVALNKYPDIFPEARDVIYDQYLKSNGVKEGLVSYSTIVQMVADWKRSAYNQDLHWN